VLEVEAIALGVELEDELRAPGVSLRVGFSDAR
jgi:hypothetical protein